MTAEKLTAEQFLAQHPEIETIDILLPDLSGVMRGKRIGASELERVLDEGAAFPASVFGTDVTGDSVAASGLVWEIGDADYPCVGVRESLTVTPWSDQPAGQLLLTMVEPDGSTPFFADPRVVLQKVAKRYANAGLKPVTALELEFYLLAIDRDEANGLQVAASQRTGQPQQTTQVYGLDELDDFRDVFRDIADACAAQNIPAMTASAEYAPGQFEINLSHVEDPVLAADQAVLLKRAIKGVARAHGFDATFMAKPFSEQTGSGLHAHVSVLDEAGNNIFEAADGSELGSEKLHHAIGGLRESLNASMAIFAPTANSYRRLRRNNYAPLSGCWGYNNRTTAFRIPSGSPSSTRVEHRVAGADANPYLATAAILAAMLDGIERRADPGKPIEGNAYESMEVSVPETWSDALSAFNQSSFIENWFGADVQRVFFAVKDHERRQFESEVTPLELTWYLTTV